MGYRVPDDPKDDPLAIDPKRCAKQRFWNRFIIHALVSLLTVGLWSPVWLGWLVLSPGRMRKFAESYRVSITGGRLVVGNETESRSVPLDAITDVRVHDGYLTITVPATQPLIVFGIADPRAAATAILDAREAHVRSRLRTRVEVREDEEELERAPAEAEKKRA